MLWAGLKLAKPCLPHCSLEAAAALSHRCQAPLHPVSSLSS